jgi:hypothetical protein
MLNDRQCNIIGYKVSGYSFNLYCKITEYGINTNNYKCTMAFGTGFKKFCLVASYSSKNPYEIYIDRIERKDNCIINDSLSDFEEGTVKLVKIALWTMTKFYPHVAKYTLIDSSQIHCGDNSNDTIHLGFDYILKYNQTWYQKKFNAELPGFIDKFVDGLTIIKSEKNSIMYKVYNSYKVLDEEIVPIQLVSDSIPFILDYKEEYSTSKTPREFIQKLRNKFGKKYCNIVGKWLNNYMFYLNISIEMDKWYIPKRNIIEPQGYSIIRLSEQNVIAKLNGGKRDTKKQHKYKYNIIAKYNLRNY